MKNYSLNSIPREIREVLMANDFELVRHNKHFIFRHTPSGGTMIVSSSQGSDRQKRNKLADIKRFLRGFGAEYKEP